MKKKLLSLLLAATLLIPLTLATTACQTTDEQALGEKVFSIAWTTDATNLNAHSNVAIIVGDVYAYVHSGLYMRVPGADRRSSFLAPDIAASEPIQVDEWTWHIPIRPEAVWHNGSPINAHTFEYSYKMLLDPYLVNGMSNFLFAGQIDILNGREYFLQNNEGNDPVAWEDVGIRAVDDYTLEIVTVQRWLADDVMRHFLDRSVFPVYEPFYEAGMNEDRTQTTYATCINTFMGAGPFFYDTWVQDALHVYTRNHDHWMTEWFHFDSVEIRVTPDRNARVQLWESGDIFTLGLDAVTWPVYQYDPRIHANPTVSPIHFDINCRNYENPLLANRYFRRALLFAMDRETIADLAGGQRPAAYYVNYDAMAGDIHYRSSPEGLANVLPNNGYDPALANEYLEKAFAEVGVTTAHIEFMYTETHATYKLIVEFLEQALPQLFGPERFSVTLNAVPAGTPRNYEDAPTSFMLNPVSWGSTASRVRPFRAFEYVHSDYPEPTRPAPIIIPEFDELYRRANTEETRLNPQLMIELTAELEAMYLHHVIQIPLYQGVGYTLMSERLILPVDEHVSALGWGVRFADIR